ncbi:hypothetical protein GYMLUDRAFT_69838 [Collybiopsis luxurians FD-317 M1]|nr:hypothetical protein GYMLUDRAFT_69838 [Collybiopsis luxurians FD-317 M1]
MAKSAAEVAHGPLFIGLIFNLTLLGTLTGQIHHYMTTFKKDKLWMKLFVAFLYLCNLVNSVLMAEYMYTSLIKHFDPAMTGIIATMVQLFFAWRVKILVRSPLAALPVIALSMCGFIGSLASAVEISSYPRFTDFVKFKAWVLLWLFGQAVADMMITLVLVIHLRNKTGFPASDQLVDKIIRLTVQTGLITTVCAIVDAITYLVDTFYSCRHLIFNLPLAKLYSVTLMSSLNSRSGWAFDSSGQDTGSRSLSAGVSTSARRKQTGVYVTTTTTAHPDVFVNVEHHEMRDINTKSSDHSPHPTYSQDDMESTREDDLKGVSGVII